ncbi:MAG: 4Fe-4S binding protein [Lentisphaeria bacterium]|nr:4Fe-4S binding protein [Lentisphaeria bacterium]
MKKASFLRTLRVITGLLVLAGFAAAGAGFAVPFIARGALVPSLLGGGFIAAGIWLGAALLGGRWYCSAFCPLGVVQDLAGIFRKNYAPRKNWKRLRYTLLLLSCIGGAAGFILPVTVLDPYSNFGRVADRLLRPLAVWISDFLWGSLRLDWVTPMEKHLFSLPVFCWTLGFFVLLTALAVWRGRWYCDMICPAGSLLGLAAKFSPFQLQITEKCIHCRKCEKLCRTGAININDEKIDFSRCVLCGECAADCPADAITYGRTPEKPVRFQPIQPERRDFLIAAGATAAAAAVGAAGKHFGAKAPVNMPVMPPGAGSYAEFHAKCTGCGLCASRCPGKTLTPAVLQYGFSGIGQMRLDFRLGKCEFECTRCMDVCPTGALRSMPQEKKQRSKIGDVTFFRDRCIVVRDGEDCGACAEHCPTGALQMVPLKGGLTVPEVLSRLCIGCGSCEYICPAEPQKAMIVKGLPIQTETPDPATVLKKKTPPAAAAGDFPF